MRHSIPLVIAALTCHASARYLPWSADVLVADPAMPTQTQPPHLSEPEPPQTTPAPSNAILELLLRRQDSTSSSSNTWENSNTCGWYSGISSKPFTCQSPLTCATNTDHVIACSTAGLTEFHTVCLNYEAVQSGKCDPAGPKTQCCSDSASPACGTMLWTGSPQRTMFACLATATAVAMLDQPQFVIDAASSSAAAASSSAAAASSSSAAAAASRSSAASASSAAAASRASELGGSSVTITTTLDGTSTTFTAVAGATGSVSGITIISSVQYTATGSDGSSTTYTAIAQNGVQGGSGNSGGDGSSGGSAGNNTAAIAGGAVGGGLGLLLLLLLLWYLLRKKSNKFSLSLCGGKKKTNKEKHVHNKNNIENDNRRYNEEKNSTYRNSGGSSPGGNSGGGGGGFSLFGGASKSKSKKEKNVTNNYYYGDEVRNDNRSYDKRAWKDNRKYSADPENNHSRDGTPNQQAQNFHFNINGQGHDDNLQRAAGGRHSTDVPNALVGVAAVGGHRRSSSRRQQGPSRGRGSRAQSYDSHSPSPSPSPVVDAAAAGTTTTNATSRRDKRKMQRKQARGDYSPEPYSPQLQPEHEAELAGRRSRRGPGDREVEVEHDDGYAGQGVYGREPAQPQQVHVHVHVHDRGSQDRERDRGRSMSSRRDRRHDYYDDDEEDELEEEERLQERERERGGSGGAHRYHPNSGRRNVPVSRSPSPPATNPAPHPDDFIGRGL